MYVVVAIHRIHNRASIARALPKYYRRSCIVNQLGAEFEGFLIHFHVYAKLLTSFVVALELFEKNGVT